MYICEYNIVIHIMNRKSLILSAAALFVAYSLCGAQSFFDFSFPDLGQGQLRTSDGADKVEFDYDVDFQYYFDNGEYKPSHDIFASTQLINMARISPSIGFRFQQDRNTTHRIMLGVDITKNLGENPTGTVKYAVSENAENLVNAKLFKDIFYYYNYQTRLGNGRFDLFAGIYPRSVMQGSYSRVFFSDITKITDPNLEGLTLRYISPKFCTEAGYDLLGHRGLDRRERFMVYTAGEYKFLDWLSAGWAGTYTRVGGADILISNVDDVMTNPYVKLDLGKKTGFQELSLKAGALVSMQLDRVMEAEPHFPMGAEGVLTIRKWNVGLENTTFFGDNMMYYRKFIYESGNGNTSYYSDLLYLGDTFYCTFRGYAAGYNRLELFYEPDIFHAMKMRISAVGHCIFPPDNAVGWFLGWQAKASLVFDLDAIRHPQKAITGNRDRGRRNVSQQAPHRNNGPEVRL